MFERLFEYFAPAARRWKPLDRAVNYIKLVLRFIRRKLSRHPVLAASILVLAVAGYLVFQAKDQIFPASKCYEIKTDNKELYGNGGDSLQFGGERNCTADKAAGIQVFTFNDEKTEHSVKTGSVLSGLFVKEQARGHDNDNKNWHEYSLYAKGEDFKKGNNVSWPPHNEQPIQSFHMEKDSCGFDLEDSKKLDGSVVREGTVIVSKYRSDPESMTHSMWEWCNRGSPDDERFAACTYIRLEFFIPTRDLRLLCESRSSPRTLLSPKMTKVYSVSDSAYNELRRLASMNMDRHDSGRMSLQDWESRTKEMPKICMRWFALNGKLLGQRSIWQEWGAVSAAWCDN